jgi:peptidoglycan/xylan/chitin deacetylase (PgdA/CDA1 family)
MTRPPLERGGIRLLGNDVESRLARRLASVQNCIPGARDEIAVTFDDGPDPDTTPVILDILREHAAGATFFVVGRAAKAHPHLVRRILEEGHALGTHTGRHCDPWRERRASSLDIDEGCRNVREIVGADVRLFRPPYGAVTFGVAREIRRRALDTWLWTRDLLDWVPRVAASSIVEECDGIRAGEVLLLHDALERPLTSSAADRTVTIAALPQILRLGHDQGLRWVTLDARRR